MLTRRVPVKGGYPDPVEIVVDDQAVPAYAGEPLAVALLAAGVRAFRRTPSGAPRAPLCNMGACFECVVDVDGRRGVRSCVTPVSAGMRVTTGEPR
ncbi:(2Fe-2S)-binding protein [Sphaerimonospora mesophila]|uniref:(2Fe-2S)-binding protein n=1 Tax=Sphaerimonospora mesophila TaxID=37483 RepID=UPI0006E1D978